VKSYQTTGLKNILQNRKLLTRSPLQFPTALFFVLQMWVAVVTERMKMFSAGNNTFLYFEGMKLDQSIVLFSTILYMSFICILKKFHSGGRLLSRIKF
jgi:hypothetical protein